MGYSNDTYRRIREAYKSKYVKAEEEADRRTAEVHAKSPELAEIDRELAKTAAEIALAVIGRGEEWEKNLAEVKAKNLALQQRRGEILTALGYPTDYTKPPYECPKCKDSGFVGVEMCDCMKKEPIYAALAESGLGNLIRTQSFENFDLRYYREGTPEYAQMRRNFEIVKTYAEGFDLHAGNLLFCGGTGLGKTHLSTALARRVIEKGYDVCYTSAVNLFGAYENARFGNSAVETDGEGTRRYNECDLLIIDDLGTEVTNQFTVSCLYMLLNNRLNRGLPTVVSTNLTPRDLQKRYVDRVASRLLGEFLLLQFVGTDIRMQKLMKK